MRCRSTMRCLAAGVVLVSAAAGCVPPAIHEQGYELVFDDDFDTFDRSVWSTNQPWYDPPPIGAITVANGVLALRSTRVNGYAKPNVTSLGPRTGSRYPHYPDASVFEEGYFEARMRFTDSAYSRPGFWMLGAEWAQRWPQEGCPTLQSELDIAEPLMLPTDQHHFAQHHNTGSPCGVPHDGLGIKRHVEFELSEWHIYAAKWSDGELCSYVDNVEIGCMPAFDSFTQPMYLILSQSGECPPWRGDLCDVPRPNELVTEVDWVRVWQVPG